MPAIRNGPNGRWLDQRTRRAASSTRLTSAESAKASTRPATSRRPAVPAEQRPGPQRQLGVAQAETRVGRAAGWSRRRPAPSAVPGRHGAQPRPGPGPVSAASPSSAQVPAAAGPGEPVGQPVHGQVDQDQRDRPAEPPGQRGPLGQHAVDQHQHRQRPPAATLDRERRRTDPGPGRPGSGPPARAPAAAGPARSARRSRRTRPGPPTPGGTAYRATASRSSGTTARAAAGVRPDGRAARAAQSDRRPVTEPPPEGRDFPWGTEVNRSDDRDGVRSGRRSDRLPHLGRFRRRVARDGPGRIGPEAPRCRPYPPATRAVRRRADPIGGQPAHDRPAPSPRPAILRTSPTFDHPAHH